MNIIDIIDKKRRKEVLSEDEIKIFINGYLTNEIKDYQLSSLLMAMCINGLNIEETAYLTNVYINSGQVLDFSNLGITVDKHSTGGIGDKVSLVLVPLVASCGVVVPKMSGKGLGITGGTIDKLESIPGLRVDLTSEELTKQLKDIGCAIFSANKDVAPADKKIYNLRSLTSTVASYGLITASILSKKIASGNKNIVIDVKFGDGAFMKNIKEARVLVKFLTEVGIKLGVNIKCIMSTMDRPLGNKVGNSLEVEEAIDTLLGIGPKDLLEVIIELASNMVSIAKGISYKEARDLALKRLNDRSAYNKFISMIEYQGGDLSMLKKANYRYVVKSTRSGYISGFDIDKLTNLNLLLGVIKETQKDAIIYENGFELLVKPDTRINVGTDLLAIYSDKKIEDFNVYESIVKIDSKVMKNKTVYKV